MPGCNTVTLLLQRNQSEELLTISYSRTSGSNSDFKILVNSLYKQRLTMISNDMDTWVTSNCYK